MSEPLAALQDHNDRKALPMTSPTMIGHDDNPAKLGERWEVRSVESHTGGLRPLLAQGWEPFAAVPKRIGSFDVTVYHLRRTRR